MISIVFLWIHTFPTELQKKKKNDLFRVSRYHNSEESVYFSLNLKYDYPTSIIKQQQIIWVAENIIQIIFQRLILSFVKKSWQKIQLTKIRGIKV